MTFHQRIFQTILPPYQRSFYLWGLLIVLGGAGACGRVIGAQDSATTGHNLGKGEAIAEDVPAQGIEISEKFPGTFQDLSSPASTAQTEEKQQFETLPTRTNREFTEATFDPITVKVGDRIAGVTLTDLATSSLEKNPDIYTGTASFKGEIILEGIYHPPYQPGEEKEFGGLWDEGPCLQVSSDSSAQLPKLQGDFRAPWVCFENAELAKELLPKRTPRARVKVAIDRYQIHHEIPDARRAFDSRGVHRARLVEVLEGGVATVGCTQWIDFRDAARSGRLSLRSPVPELPQEYQEGCVVADQGARTLSLYVFPKGQIPQTIPVPRSMQDWEIFKVVPFGIVRDRPEALAEGVVIVRYDSGQPAEQFAKEKAWSQPHIRDESSVAFRYLWLESKTIPTEEMVRLLAATQDEWDKPRRAIDASEKFCGKPPLISAPTPSAEIREILVSDRGLAFGMPANYYLDSKIDFPGEERKQGGVRFSIYDPNSYDYVLCSIRTQTATVLDLHSVILSIFPANQEEPWQNLCSKDEISEYNQKVGVGRRKTVDVSIRENLGIVTALDEPLVNTGPEVVACMYSPDRGSNVSISTRYSGEVLEPFDRGKIHNSSLYENIISSLRFSRNTSEEVPE